jgi:hypothetical protein
VSELVEVPVIAPVTTREALHRAADLLEEFGWCQFHPAKDDDGWGCLPYDKEARSFCLTGSVERAIFDLTGHRMRYDGPYPGIKITMSRPDGYTGEPKFSPEWNNDPSRTKADVVAVLREAAEATA